MRELNVVLFQQTEEEHRRESESITSTRRRRSIKERVGQGLMKGWGCCSGALSDEEDDILLPGMNNSIISDSGYPSMMNLAAALAVERQLRAQRRVSLIRLLEEDSQEGVGDQVCCCVCMVRKKDAAFIPCGHTYCRLCSTQLWLNRGSCPLCNRPILHILHIF